MNTKNKAVFLDRDGVINLKRDDYVKSVEEFVILKDVSDAIKLLNENNYLVIIITNQSAINRGLLTDQELFNIHKFMKSELAKDGAHVDAIYHCPHRPDENCSCRKPGTELVEMAVMEHSVSTKSSWFIGDSEIDILSAKKMGLQGIKIKENSSLLEPVKKILDSKKRDQLELG